MQIEKAETVGVLFLNQLTLMESSSINSSQISESYYTKEKFVAYLKDVLNAEDIFVGKSLAQDWLKPRVCLHQL